MGIRRGAWLAESIECATLDLGVVSLSPTLGVDLTLKKRKADGNKECVTDGYKHRL